MNIIKSFDLLQPLFLTQMRILEVIIQPYVHLAPKFKFLPLTDAEFEFQNQFSLFDFYKYHNHVESRFLNVNRVNRGKMSIFIVE